jgi:predicted nucleic-acid-binding protein
MKITVDTNVLVRAVVLDDERQARRAAKLLKDAEAIALPLPCLCELVWVLRRVYSFGQPEIASALEALLNAGLAFLKQGGDFADGLIACEGALLGGNTFVSFDKKAVSLMQKQGLQARLLT